MNKRILSLLCALALLLGVFLVMGSRVQAAEVTDTTETTAATEAVVTEECPVCGEEITGWETLTSTTTYVDGGHYRLTGDVTRSQVSLATEMTVCIDLAGYTIESSSNRAFLLGSSSGGVKVEVNIMDSSEDKTGRIQSDSSDATSGGVIYMYKGATVNLYSGTVGTIDPNLNAAKIGAVFHLRTGAILNMYGGTIEGGKAIERGGAVNLCNNAELNMWGGKITNGSAPTGTCVYAENGADIKLGNNASIADIYFEGDPAGGLTISGTYTGSVNITPATALEDGDSIAVLASSADISNATISITDSTLMTAVSGSSLVAGEGRWCEACRDTVIWQNLDSALPTSADGHYRLTQNVSASQTTIKTNNTICLDLAGYTYTGATRAFVLGASSGSYSVTLNVMDSSDGKTGILQAYGSSNYTAGVIYVYKNTTLNFYSGTMQLASGGSANQGGVIATWASSEVNIYDGKIVGGKACDFGGAVYVRGSSTLNMYGGSITGGNAVNVGDCVYVASSGVINLYNDAAVEQMYFAGSSAEKLTIHGDYTGSVELAYAEAPALDADLGNCSEATVVQGSITIDNSRYIGMVSGTDLKAAAQVGAAVISKTGTVAFYDTLAAALENWIDSSAAIKLLADNAEDVTVSGDVVLNLYGWDVSGNITVTGTLSCYDSSTDDYTIEDVEGYGVISGTVTGEIKNYSGYLKLTNDGLSFHKYTLKLTSVNLRPGNTGIYYNSDIVVDEAVLAQIDRFGITVSVNRTAPTAEEIDTGSLYTSYTADQYGSEEATSVLIQNIMEEQDENDEMATNAATNIYGRPYIMLKDGSFIYGGTYYCNLQQLTEIVDSNLANLNLTQRRAYAAMYETYETAMAKWNVSEIKTSFANADTAANDKVLKVLVIGNSHGLDSTNLLYEVFKAEGLPEEYDNLVLGAIYTGGCSVATHAKNAWNDLPYDYWKKNDGSTEDGSWIHTEDPTMREVLEDENWDIVLLQEMNTNSAREETFQNDNIEAVFTFVVKTLGYEPEFMWNMIWANPQIPESYVAYLGLGSSAGSDESVGDGSEGDDNDTSDALTEAKKRAWIFQTQNPGTYATGWPSNYVNLWDNNRQVMYNNIVSNVHNYVIGKAVHNIGYDDVMPNATAIQYAIEWMGMEEQDMYRDYTHVSDLGRLTVAYLWYAKLTGKTSIEAPQYTQVSQILENSRQVLGYAKDYSQYGDLIRQSVNFALADPYGVIQNLTYAEYLALTADEQADYEASFASFSVSSGWTYEKWLEAAVAGATYTDYIRMTDEQKTAYAALQSDFDTWYNGVVENLTYAEYFVLADAEKTAYAALCGDTFDAWLAEASAAFTYSDYVMMTYEQQVAYQATFAEGEFDTLYAGWLANMTYEEYMGLTMHQKVRYKKTYSGTDAFLVWYEAAKAAYESANA